MFQVRGEGIGVKRDGRARNARSVKDCRNWFSVFCSWFCDIPRVTLVSE